MPDTATIPASPPFAPQSVIWQKRGPLPVWAWMLIGVAVLFMLTWWRRNRTAAASATSDAYSSPTIQQQGYPAVFVLPPLNDTGRHRPPGGGREQPPTGNPGSQFPPPPNEITVTGGANSDSFINQFSTQYGIYWGQLADMYPGIVENIKGGGPTATFKSTKTFKRKGT